VPRSIAGGKPLGATPLAGDRSMSKGTPKARSHCRDCPSLAKGLCSALADDELAQLSSATWQRRYQPGQVIHAEGEVPPSFCAIMSGTVKLMKSLPSGSHQIVGLGGPGDFLGRPVGGEARATAVAASEVSLCWFPRATIERVAAQSGSVKDWLFERVSDDLEKAQEWIMLLGRMTAEQKIAALLLSVLRTRAGRCQQAAAVTDVLVELPLSRTEIADYLGLTIETVSRQLARLRERRVITVGSGRTLVIHRPDALEDVLDGALPGDRSKQRAQF
jgi:CRP/FNR family transcriptional regulator